MRDYNFYVYLLASRRNGTLYVGVTNDVVRRISEHKLGTADGFTKKYGVYMLVWYDHHTDIGAAIANEKRLKRWRRQWKIELIEKENPTWEDLYLELIK